MENEDMIKLVKRTTQTIELTLHQLYGVPLSDPELIQRMSDERDKIKKEKYLDMVKDIPATCLQERLDNADKIQKWLEVDV